MKELQNEAEALEKINNYQEAAAFWGKLSEYSEQQLVAAGCPSLMEIKLRQAGAYFQSTQFNAAIAILEPLGSQRVKDAEISSLLVRAYFEAKRYQDVVDQAKKTLEIDPDAIKTKQILGRAYMQLAEQAGSDGATLWQEAINQFSDILILFNPRDEISKEMKRRCVVKRDNSFLDTVKTKFREFEGFIERDNSNKAFEILNELVCMVIEHAVDIQEVQPRKTVQIAKEFRKMIEDYSQRSSRDIASQMRSVFAQLHALAMWAHWFNDETGEAQLELEKAIEVDREDTRPWLSKAGLMFVLKKQGEVEPALNKAHSLVRCQYDHYLMCATYHLLGNYDSALEWYAKINIEKFKDEVYRPDRAEAILRRLKADIEQEKEEYNSRTPEDIASGDNAEALKRTFGGGAKTVH